MKFESPELTKALESIENGLALMRENNVFPIEYKGKTTTEEGLRNEIETLLNEPYTVAVCGVVKAGKSSLLNSLIFGDTVLPSFDTPLTAKLTFIEYTEEPNPYFEVSFYDRKEWEEILERFGEAERQALEARVEQCAERGARLNAYVLSERHETVRVDDLGKLEEYVTDPNNGKGIYTPFVKSVTVRLHNESIKAIRIVDTPGLNDANVINSIETANWVAKAHAVIYVLKVRGAAAADVEFFESYFPSTAVDARIFVQNQIDTEPEGYKAARAAIRRYGAEQKYKNMGLFGPNETICSYSALGMLLKAKAERGDDLTEEEQEYWNDFQEMGISDFDPDHLAETLAKKLYAREGHVRIDRIRAMLSSACDKAAVLCAEAHDKAKNKMKDATRSIEECDKEIEAYDRFQRKLEKLTDDTQFDFEREVEERKTSILNALSTQLTQMENALHGEANKCGGIPSELKTRVPRKLEQLVRDQLVPTIKPMVDKAIASLRERLDNIPKELDKEATEAGLYDEIRVPSLELILGEMLESLRFAQLVNPEVIYNEVPCRFVQFFIGEQSANNTAANIAKEELRNKIKELQRYLEDDFTQVFMRAFNEICNQYTEYSNNRRKELQTAKDNHDALQRDFAQLEAEVRTLAAREAALMDFRKEMLYLLEA